MAGLRSQFLLDMSARFFQQEEEPEVWGWGGGGGLHGGIRSPDPVSRVRGLHASLPLTDSCHDPMQGQRSF